MLPPLMRLSQLLLPSMTVAEKRKINNLRRKEGPIKRKDEALSDPNNVSWL